MKGQVYEFPIKQDVRAGISAGDAERSEAKDLGRKMFCKATAKQDEYT